MPHISDGIEAKTEKVKTALIGLGQRGSSILSQVLLGLDNCEVVAICDV